MLKRSSSSSHIPIRPSQAGRRSQSASRSSVDKVVAPIFKRTGSSTNLRKTSFATPVQKPNLLRSAQKNTGTIPKQSLGFKRSSVTPRGKSRSPYKPGSELGVVDNKWVSEQRLKVVHYLQQYHPFLDEGIIENVVPGLAINTFITVMETLLKDVCPNIVVNKTNYKEIIPRTLKIFQYPGNVKDSFMRSVNTRHSWPHVAAMFGWLVDLIMMKKRAECPPGTGDVLQQKFDLVLDYYIKGDLAFNNCLNVDLTSADEEFKKKFGELLNVDEQKYDELKQEVAVLAEKHAELSQKYSERKIRTDKVTKETEKLQAEINEFYSTQMEKDEDVDSGLEILKKRRQKLKDAMQTTNENILMLNETLKNQPWTLKEKNEVANNIELLKHKINLKREQIKVQNQISSDYELKLLDLKKKVESEVFRLNNSLMKLIVLEPRLKILQLKSADFTSGEFKAEVEMFRENVNRFKKQFAGELQLIEKRLITAQGVIVKLESELVKQKEILSSLNASKENALENIKLCENELQTMHQKREMQRKAFQTKINHLRESEARLIQLKEKHQSVLELKEKKQKALNTLKVNSVNFFVKLDEILTKNLLSMNDIREDIAEMLKNCMSGIADQQDAIAEEMQSLEDLQKNDVS